MIPAFVLHGFLLVSVLQLASNSCHALRLCLSLLLTAHSYLVYRSNKNGNYASEISKLISVAPFPIEHCILPALLFCPLSTVG
jgi:hypothetical protein